MKLCVIGHPVSHSRSPLIHRELLSKASLTGSYTAIEVTPETLPAFVAQAKAGAYDGFNVTMPLKQCIVPLLDQLGPEVKDAVNTVVIRQGRAVGHNTDGSGFLRCLPFSPRGKRCLILGAGGAARAIAAALGEAGGEVQICSRKKCVPSPAKTMLWAEMDTSGFDLLVNATPLGMVGQEDFSDFTFLDSLPAHAVVFDLVYEPVETKLLQQSASRNLTAIGGLALLQSQAELAFSYFTAP